jgi:hypothetical protein
MEVLRNGKFALRYDSNALIRGIQPNAKQTRSQYGIETLTGMIGIDGSLVSLPSLTRIATTAITDSFPYPQLFVLNRFSIICGETEIYEYDGSTLTLKLTVSAGTTWSLVHSYEYVYLSNGTVSVERDPSTKAYTLSSLPAFYGACNYNGQLMLGAPKEI